jgi:hypothetical protein
MLRLKLVKNGASGAGHISGVMVVAYLILGWSRPAFSVETTASPDEQPHLQLAPIYISHSLGGNIGYFFDRTTNGPNKYIQQTLGVGVTAHVSVRSFFWQPWFAQVSTSLIGSVFTNNTHTNTAPNYHSQAKNISGDAALKVLNTSRFPFEAHIFKDDTSITALYSGTNDSTQVTGYSLDQRYQSRSQRLTGSAVFTSKNRYSGLNTGPIHEDLFNFGLTDRLTRTQVISIYGATNRVDNRSAGTSFLYDTLTANHSYQPNTIFSVSSLANQLKYDYGLKAQASSPAQQYDSSALQFNSFAAFRPEKSPLTMTSSVRFLSTDNTVNGAAAPTLNNTNFNLGANYLFSPFIRMYGSVNVADSLGTQTVATSTALTAAKPFRFANQTTGPDGFIYSGSAGGTVSTATAATTIAGNQTSTNALNLGAYLSHALDKNTEIGGGRLSENLNQSLTMSHSLSASNVVNTNRQITNLTTSGSLGWSQSEGSAATHLRLSATDSRYLSEPRRAFQMVNLQASRSEALSRNESLQGNLTVQGTHSQQAGQASYSTLTPSAELNYLNLRLLKVRDLTYNSVLRISEGNIAPVSYYVNQDQAIRSWTNDLDYKIGVLVLKLHTIIAVVRNTPRSTIMFMMNRPF